MTVFYVAIVLMNVSLFGTLAHLVERYSCEAIANKKWRICKWAHFAIEHIYYLRTEYGEMLYVGQTVNKDRRWEQHIAEGLAKGNWKALVHEPANTVVRYCWTYGQSMRVERRRTIAIWLGFSLWLGVTGRDCQIHNVSNTPLDTRRGIKAHEWATAALFLPFYLLEGWLIPEAQWATPVNMEQFCGNP